MGGSSPLARGTDSRCPWHQCSARFIPACAGNGLRYSRGRSDHPGSSPLARGTAEIDADKLCPARFIPACAGNGSPPSGAVLEAPVHPRLRGERAGCREPIVFGGGSSPLARGTGGDFVSAAICYRFIPACAGNGCGTARSEISIPVHPRLRGERTRPSFSRSRYSGSSPLARGTVIWGCIKPMLHRFIPACAGNGSTAE